MNNLLYLSPSNADCNNPAEYNQLNEWQKARLQYWIASNIEPHELDLQIRKKSRKENINEVET